MTEAVQAALRFGFDTLGLDRVELWIDERNDRSFRLAERVGFARRAAFREKYPHDKETHEKVVYGLHVAEWRGDRTQTVPEGKAYGLFPIVPVRDVRLTAEYYRDTRASRSRSLWRAADLWRCNPQPMERVRRDNPLFGGPSLTPYSLYVSVGPDIGRLEARYRERGVEILQHLARMPWDNSNSQSGIARAYPQVRHTRIAAMLRAVFLDRDGSRAIPRRGRGTSVAPTPARA